MPFTYVDKENKGQGLYIDIWKLWASKNNYTIEFVPSSWIESVKKVKAGETDFHASVYFPEKNLFLAPAIHSDKISLFIKKSKSENFEISNNIQIGVIDPMFGKALKNEYPNVNIKIFESYSELLPKVINEEIDGLFDTKLAVENELIQKKQLHLFSIFDNKKEMIVEAKPASNNKELIDIFEKGWQNLSDEELLDIESKWIYNKEDRSIKSEDIFTLTEEEKNWIKEHPILNIGAQIDWPPFDFVNENGEHTGIAKDYLNEISKKTGLEFNIIINPSWTEILNNLKNGDLDIIPAIIFSKKRNEYLNFSNPYLSISDYFITKKDYPKINSIEELFGKKVVSVKGYEVTSWLEQYPKINLIEVNTILEALKSIESNESIAFLSDNPSTTYTSERYFISGLKLNNIVKSRTPISLHMTTKKENKILISIINKAIKDIDIEQRRTIANKWMKEIVKKTEDLELTQKETQWLNTKPVLKFSIDPNWEPIESINEDTSKYEGITADILEKISELTTLEFQFIPTRNWENSLEEIKNNNIHMLSALSITKERKEFLNFTSTIFSLTDGVIMKKDASFISTLNDLEKLKIGVPKNSELHKRLKKDLPNLNLIPISGIKKGIEELRANKIDAFVGNLEVASNIIFKNNYFDLRIVLKLEKKRTLHIGLNKNIPIEARDIINKAIKKLTEDEINTIRQKWIGLKINENIDYTIFYKIALGIILLVAFFLYWNHKLKRLVEEKTSQIQSLLQSFDKNVLATKTDLEGNITYASKAFLDNTGYKHNEIIGKNHNIIKHPDTKDEIFSDLWNTIENNKIWVGEIKNKNKDGSSNWVHLLVEPDFDKEGNKIGYSSIREDITAKKEVEELSRTLEIKVEERTSELKESQKQSESILSSVLLPMIITSKETRKIVYANEFAEKQYETTLDELIGLDIDRLYTSENQKDELLNDLKIKGKIINFETKFKTLKEKEFDAILSLVDIKYKGIDCYLGVASDITEQKKRELLFQELHKNMKESIEYASLIQHALIPEKDVFKQYFPDYFSIWSPKDIVGGDIYLFEELRSKDECLLMVIDCTGHGVAGAFVTMLVKAIERQIVSKIVNNEDMEVSPSIILSYFNKSMKRILRQEDESSISNAGFDGGILYYNKKENIIKYAGAETPLFYFENGELKTIKGDRHSIGYKKSDVNYKFKEHVINIKEDINLYITTDGYLDQNGGEKSFPFGKKRFKTILEENYTNTMQKQKETLIDEIQAYQEFNERNDDMTIVGLKINK